MKPSNRKRVSIMSDNNIKDNITTFGVKTLLNHIDKNPEKSIEKTLNLLVKLDKNGKYIGNRAGSIQQFMSDKDNNWYKLVNSLWTDIDDGVRRRVRNINAIYQCLYLWILHQRATLTA